MEVSRATVVMPGPPGPVRRAASRPIEAMSGEKIIRFSRRRRSAVRHAVVNLDVVSGVAWWEAPPAEQIAPQSLPRSWLVAVRRSSPHRKVYSS